MSGLLADIEAWGGGVMVTVIEAVGSTPRGCGSYMVVDGSGGLALGTIGGGALELEAIRRARRLLDTAETTQLHDIPLGPELGQCCGGRVTLLFERLPIAVAGQAQTPDPVVVTQLEPPFARTLEARGPMAAPGCLDFGSGGRLARLDGRRVLVQPAGRQRQPVVVFGAGHVGRALVGALSPLPFAVRWIDDRPDQFPADAAGLAEIVATSAPADQVAGLAPGAFVLIMTHSHGLDFEILRRALTRDDLGYVGLIGSATKRARFIKRLRAYGADATAIGRFHCPIGLPQVSGKEPAVIAASVAVDLLIRREQLRAVAEPATLAVVS
ncbi:MAG: xanthine dehydrogenase accessory protein XdhC [Alphaproteobacteria bacterium]